MVPYDVHMVPFSRDIFKALFFSCVCVCVSLSLSSFVSFFILKRIRQKVFKFFTKRETRAKTRPPHTIRISFDGDPPVPAEARSGARFVFSLLSRIFFSLSLVGFGLRFGSINRAHHHHHHRISHSARFIAVKCFNARKSLSPRRTPLLFSLSSSSSTPCCVFCHTHTQQTQDVRKELEAYCQLKDIQAGCIVTAVGSVQKARIRLASSVQTNANEIAELTEERFEIVSMTGTISAKNGMHIHIAVADANGEVCGGHLLEGCEVFTTCEIVLGECKRFAFERHEDVNTGHKELVVVKNTARELESEYYLDGDEDSAGTPTGKKARRIRQMRMMEMERERLQQSGERRGLFSRIAAVIVPPPTPMRTVNEVANEV